MTEGLRALRGFRNGLIISIVFWAIIFLAVRASAEVKKIEEIISHIRSDSNIAKNREARKKIEYIRENAVRQKEEIRLEEIQKQLHEVFKMASK